MHMGIILKSFILIILFFQLLFPNSSYSTQKNCDLCIKIKKYFKYIPIFDLSFGERELLQILKTDHLFIYDFGEKIENLKQNAIKYNLKDFGNEQIDWFLDRIINNDSLKMEFPEQIEQIANRYRFPKYSRKISEEFIKESILKIEKNNFDSEYNESLIDLFAVHAELIAELAVNSVQIKEKLNFWIDNLTVTGFYSPWTPVELMERKKQFILTKYSDNESTLMKHILKNLSRIESRETK